MLRLRRWALVSGMVVVASNGIAYDPTTVVYGAALVTGALLWPELEPAPVPVIPTVDLREVARGEVG